MNFFVLPFRRAFGGYVGLLLAIYLILPQDCDALAPTISAETLFTNLYGDVPLCCDLQTRLISPAVRVNLDGTAFTEAESGTITLTVRIENIRELRGVVRVALFASAEGFPNRKEAIFRQQITEASAESVRITFADLPPGTYAVAVQHDKNNDGRLNRNTLGIPKEPYGFSNNARATFGPPSFNTAAFLLESNATQTITLK